MSILKEFLEMIKKDNRALHFVALIIMLAITLTIGYMDMEQEREMLKTNFDIQKIKIEKIEVDLQNLQREIIGMKKDTGYIIGRLNEWSNEKKK